MAKPAFVCLYLDYRQTFAPFTDAERGRLVTAMLEFAQTGAVPEFTGNERFAWPMLQGQIQRDQQKYIDRCEKNRRNALKRSKPEEAGEGLTDVSAFAPSLRIPEDCGDPFGYFQDRSS